jgi:hypothetical protein
LDARTAQTLAHQHATLRRMVGELDRHLELNDAWRALTALESVGMAAGGAISYAWKARHEELQTVLEANPAYVLRAHLIDALAALPTDDRTLSEAIDALKTTVATDRRESIAHRIATLQPALLAPPADLPIAVATTKPEPTAIAPRFEVEAADPVATATQTIIAALPHLRSPDAKPAEEFVEATNDDLPVTGATAPATDLDPVDIWTQHVDMDRWSVIKTAHALSTTAVETEPSAEVVPTYFDRDISEVSPGRVIDVDQFPDVEEGWDPGFDEADLDSELDAEEAEVVVVQRQSQSQSLETLEVRLARMDRDSVGLVRVPPRGPSEPMGLSPDRLTPDRFTRLRSVFGGVSATVINPMQPVERPQQSVPLPAAEVSLSKSEQLGFEAQVEIVRRTKPSPQSTAATGVTPITTKSPDTVRLSDRQSHDMPEPRARPERTEYPAEPTAAFVAAMEEASVEIVRPAQPTSWRPTMQSDLEPVPVNRFLKALNGG